MAQADAAFTRIPWLRLAPPSHPSQHTQPARNPYAVCMPKEKAGAAVLRKVPMASPTQASYALTCLQQRPVARLQLDFTLQAASCSKIPPGPGRARIAGG